MGCRKGSRHHHDPALAPPADARRLAKGLLGEAPDRIVAAVCERAEGNPLFLEQLAAMLEDAGHLEGGRWTGGPEVTLEIPSSVQALLAARVDRLDLGSRAKQ